MHALETIHNPTSNYMSKVSNRSTRTGCETLKFNHLKLSIEVPEQRYCHHSGVLTLNIFTPCSIVSIVNFEQANARGGGGMVLSEVKRSTKLWLTSVICKNFSKLHSLSINLAL